MSAQVKDIDISIDDLEAMVDKMDDPMEKEGLKAFITNMTPKLAAESTGTFLGKIKAHMHSLPNDITIEGALDELSDEYHVEIE
ncbi:hypothetical protein HNR44_001698 [Geomicrobium halophilum]|uniref:Uncharacterized protein n=1 Tax=Geomicrobium halophilum TaxID=549000 RepID=A0A841PLT1_9BACL|nr:histidine kinase [Geomicrobium halophilum]MBB6449720.1 hypothetical protein [Geomicrobium halophilum]